MKKKMAVFTLVCVFFCMQSLESQTWSSTQRLTWTAGISRNSAVASKTGNNIHVVWEDLTPGVYQIYYKTSTNGGNNWGPIKRLTWTGYDCGSPAVAVDSNNNPHVVWSGDTTTANSDIYYKRSTDGGVTWSAPKRLTWTSGFSWAPKIAVDSNNNPHVVWYDTTNGYEIYYKKSTNGGNNWSATTRITWNPAISYLPDIAVDSGNNPAIVWWDGLSGNYEVYLKRSSDGGTNWEPLRRLTWGTDSSTNPVIAISSNNHIHVAWEGIANYKLEIFYKKSTNGGVAWSARQRITWNSGDSEYPNIDVDSNNNPHVVWEDDSYPYFMILHKQSNDGGSTWGVLDRLTWVSSRYPDITVDPNNYLHVVWASGGEIYYKNRK